VGLWSSEWFKLKIIDHLNNDPIGNILVRIETRDERMGIVDQRRLKRPVVLLFYTGVASSYLQAIIE